MKLIRLIALFLVLSSFDGGEMAARGGGGRGGGGRAGGGRVAGGRAGAYGARPMQRTPTLSRAAYRTGYRRGSAYGYGYGGGGYYYDSTPTYYYPTDPYYNYPYY